MTTKLINKQKLCAIVLSLVIYFLSIPYSYSSITEEALEEINLGGRWTHEASDKLDRSISLIPIEAFVDGHNIYILNSAPDCDIHITILNNNSGSVEFEQTIPKSATAYITIPINVLKSGKYTLQLSNKEGGNLQGTFYK